MSQLHITSQVPSTDLSKAIRDLTERPVDSGSIANLGPGIAYLLEMESGQIEYFSKREGMFPQAFYRLLEGCSAWEEVVGESDRDRYRVSVALSTFEEEVRYKVYLNKRGETLDVIDHRKLLRNSEGKAVAILGRIADDTFYSVSLEALSRRSWKEIAGAMTRRFLHDFNNTIAGIYSLSELYAEPGSDPASTAEAMGHIRDCSIRAEGLTKRIRHLTTLETGQSNYFDLGAELEELRPFMEALLPKGATINVEIEDGQHPSYFDLNLFQQVILHLTANSADACREDAKVEISVSRVEKNGRSFGKLVFSDNGSGFESTALERGAENFFTTKDPDKHHGLGLSIARDFARDHGGELTLANREKGATVSLKILLLEKESSKKKPATQESAGAVETDPHCKKAAGTKPRLIVYSWEDITRHPLVEAMQSDGWQTTVYLEPGPLLLDLLQEGEQLDGVLVFKSALDEKAEPLISELGYAKNCRKVALLTLEESIDTLSSNVKRNCGLIASGTLKPTALISKLGSFFG